MTRAAELLHLTQPTLSRQIMGLEKELETTLFRRERYQVTLTEEGVLFQQRAREIIAMVDKTQREFVQQKDSVSGVVSIGFVESTAMDLLPAVLAAFSGKYPLVQYDLYSGCGDDIKEKIDKGLIDVGILTEPLEIGKYQYARLENEDRWGLLMRRDDALAGKESIRMEELAGLPLILPKRELLRNEIANWFEGFDEFHVIAAYSLLLGARFLVEQGMGYAVCLEGAGNARPDGETAFVPFSPERPTGNVMIWKKERSFNPVTALFVDFLRRWKG